MTKQDIAQMIKEMGDALSCPTAYYQFREKVTAPRYIIFYYPSADDFFADGKNYSKITDLYIEFYSEEPDFEAEAVIEECLETHDLGHLKAGTFIESENMWQVLYEMEVLIHG